VPVAVLWFHSEALMVGIGQDPAISAMAGRYLSLVAPCIFLDIATDCMKKYLQAQSIVAPAMWATTVATLASPLFFYVAIHVMGWGLDGAAAALILCHVTPLVGVAAFVLWHTKQNAGSPTSTWGGFSRQERVDRTGLG
jgi:MATE family multidrug resistance protein